MLDIIRVQARTNNIRVTQHAQQEMTEEQVSLDEVLEAVSQGNILEKYPQHRRGACCLVCGFTRSGRALHVVCTTTLPFLIIITVYEPTLPKWITPLQRRQAT
jgi:hypothetical protein